MTRLCLLLVGVVALALCCFSLGSCTAAKSIRIVQTAKGPNDLLKRLPDAHFNASSAGRAGRGGEAVDVDVSYTLNPNVTFQQIIGWGGAITDSVAHIFAKLPSNLQQQVLDAFYTPQGLNYTMARLTVGSCDFSVGSYSYCDQSGDYNMSSFSIAHDKELIIPLIHRIQQTRRKSGGEIKFFSSIWSPPAWMKRNDNMRNSDKPGLIQKPDIFQALALYYSKYVTEYGKEGIPLWAITVQNEPHVADQFLITYECCGYTPSQEAAFLGGYLGPQMRKDHPEVKIMIHDDQKTNIVESVNTILNDSQAAQYVWGVAYHWYGDFLKNYHYLHQVHQHHPSLPMLATEATLEAYWKQIDDVWTQGSYFGVDILGDLNGWANGWVHWNILLDWYGGPEHSWGPCDAPIRCDFETCESINYGVAYYYMGQFSKFIPTGSVRIEVKNNTKTDLLSTAFLTPENQVVFVVQNTGDASQTYQLNYAKQFAELEIPANAIQTLSFAA